MSKQDAEFVEEQMNSGLYDSADAVVTAGLALLREQEEATLRELIQEAMDDVDAGRVMSFDSAEELTAYIMGMAEEREDGTTSSGADQKGTPRSSRAL
ncbi:type II toxin-antitoxin system ParD family antitoxin [Agrobacterium albertimagni]|uniref:type II toxin-antitoxin system ParD family antitoxin n=1 Tax=Agrobacterium albertimagni TaxID=147266 RepID=UPI001F0A3D2D|nr:type II toxin-antitoxin system ParD family antitoxin [Agrobacterium albertimagni]